MTVTYEKKNCNAAVILTQTSIGHARLAESSFAFTSMATFGVDANPVEWIALIWVRILAFVDVDAARAIALWSCTNLVNRSSYQKSSTHFESAFAHTKE